jgi:tetratricopeptide (TPR) repeat protein
MAIAINPKRHWRAGLIGPVVCLLIAVGAIARFATAGHGGAARSVVTRSADPATSAVTEAATALSDAIETGDPARYAAVDVALARAGGAPGSAGIHAALLLSRHEFGAARTLVTAELRTTPSDRSLLAAAVDAAVETGDYDAAAETLQQLADLRPDARALSRISYLRELHGDLTGALVAMRQAEQASLEPSEHATVATFLGDLCLSMNDLSCAQTAYDTALHLRPNAVNASLGRARLLAAKGSTSEAIALATSVVERSPQPSAASLLGELQTLAGDHEGAANSFAVVAANTKLLTAAGVVTDLEAATFEADHGDATRAVELARAAYANRQTVFTADALGWALTRAGRASEAMPYVREATALDTASGAVQTHAAVALEATGDSAAARDLLQRALAHNPWTTPSVRTAAINLAGSLGVDLPKDWRL